MRPILFRIGDASFASYFLAYALGFGLCTWLACARCKRAQLGRADVLAASAVGMLGVLLGGRFVYHVVIHPRALLQDPTSWLRLWEGDFVLFGGLLGAPALMAIHARLRGIRVLDLLDLFAPAVGLAIAVGRVGCFLAGCCYGHPTDVPWAVQFLEGPAATLGPVHPVQLYESIAGLGIFLAPLAFERRRRFPGQLVLLAVGGYAAARFVLEEFRGDGRGHVIAVAGLSTSQTIAIAVLLVTIAAHALLSRAGARGPVPTYVHTPKVRPLRGWIAIAAVVGMAASLVAFSILEGRVARQRRITSFERDPSGGIRLVPYPEYERRWRERVRDAVPTPDAIPKP